MDILSLIKNKKVVRKYKKKEVTQKITDKLIETGVWSSSIHGFQPWKLVVVNNSNGISKLANCVTSNLASVKGSMSELVDFSSTVVRNAQLVIMVYSTREFVDISNKFFKIDKSHIKIAEITEIECISALIQNMLLTAESLGIGNCWLSAPLFCEKQINSFLDIKEDKLVAILTFGYPLKQEKRSRRKNYDKKVIFYND